jgi:hypothetical protein
MNMKTFFAFLIAIFLTVPLLSETPPSGEKTKAILSYALPSKLEWEQVTSDDLDDDMQSYTLGDDKNIKLYSMQTGNANLWDKFSTMDKEKIFQELVAGKKLVHQVAGYKNWNADKSLQKKSDKEIIFEITGNYLDDGIKKFFVEKYYMTPYGFILISLDWTEKSEASLSKKAQAEFKNISFKSELK